jgi:zinc ribbon protein
MAFCNSCGAALNAGTKFCNKCGAAVPAAPAAPGVTSSPLPPAPQPSKGGSSALKIILIIVAVIIGIGLLGMVTCGIVLHRIAKSAHVTQKGDSVKVDTPFGSFSANDPDQTVKELGVDVYPGAQVQKAGTASVSFGSIHTVTANFESSDSVDKVCDFYKAKFPTANIRSSDQNQCNIVAGDQANSTTVSVQSRGDGCTFQIVSLSKKSSN